MALSVVYFRITHRLGRPHYVWDEYLYSLREKVEVGVIVSVTVEGETRCRLIACSSRKAPKGPPGLTSPSDCCLLFNDGHVLQGEQCGPIFQTFFFLRLREYPEKT